MYFKLHVLIIVAVCVGFSNSVTLSECQSKTSISEIFLCFAQLQIQQQQQCSIPENINTLFCSPVNGSSVQSSFIFSDSEVSEDSTIPAIYMNVTRTVVSGTSRACNAVPNVSSSDRLERSTCPWVYVINRDGYRFPSTIIEARCDCPRCASPFSFMDSGRCLSITRYIRALRTVGCVGGIFQYRNVWERIVVGCHCVFDQEVSI